MSATATQARARVVLSNGYGQFHLQDVAGHLAERGLLDQYLSGAHVRNPRAPVRRLAGLLGPGGARLMDRAVHTGDAAVRRAWIGEGLHQAARRVFGAGHVPLGARLETASLRAYGRAVKRTVQRSDAPVYHYRAGFGNASLDAARARGMTLLCDHSIAHPEFLRRTLPETSSVHAMRTFWDVVSEDIDRADHLLVNSEFVAETCIDAGVPADIISVVPTVPDDRIIDALHLPAERADPPVALFVGSFEHRKGVRELVEAVEGTAHLDLRWVLVGEWEPEALGHRPQESDRVRLLPRLPRRDVAAWMTRSTFFVFPTWAEGSARVVAEALHGGCSVITTPNAGSVVRDGIDGTIVAPGDSRAVVRALEEALALPPAVRAARSAGTADHARSVLTPASYRDGVLQVHEGLLDGRLVVRSRGGIDG